jgi:hypothetical protein
MLHYGFVMRLQIYVYAGKAKGESILVCRKLTKIPLTIHRIQDLL